MTQVPHVVHVFSDFEKIKNWRFYGQFSVKFLPGFKMVHVHCETVLRDGWLDSLDILQQHEAYAWSDASYFRF